MRHGSTLVCLFTCVLIAVATVGPVHAGGGWTLPDQSRGMRVAPILLLSRPDVQLDLHLKPEQVAAAAEVVAAIHARAAHLRGRTDGAAIELRRKVDDEQRTWLDENLTQDQIGRLAEIDLQWEGTAALATRPGVAEGLSLAEGQRATIAHAVAERNAQRTRPAERQRDPEVAERHLDQQVFTTLSDGQRRRWEKMLGRPFAVAAAAPAVGTTVR